MYLMTLFLPLYSAVLCGFFGYFLGRQGVIFLSNFCIFTTCFYSMIIFYQMISTTIPCYITLGSWVNIELLNVNWGFMFDALTSVMLIVINIVSFLVHLYSSDYMENDPHLPRFMSYLSLFTFFMIVLVTSDNFLQMFIGWEGVGLCSYLLINFWYGRIQANKAALKAIIINKIGDFSLIIAFVSIFFVFNSLDYTVVFALVPYFTKTYIIILNYKFNTLNFICFFLLIGAMTKSAQIGLHVWLPDAMEGPTPVSALIHAATMVTAGIFLIVRCSPLFEFAPDILFLMTIIGALTAFIASTIGLVQNDIKKIIAYSTCSQLGYMFFACGLSNYQAAMFHLTNHAFFKALLFLGAGSIIHSLNDEQDIRRFGGLINLLPFTYAMMFIGSLSLMGFPFLTGFYSKDLILELAYAKYTISSHFAFWLGSIAAFCTSFYSIRLLYLTFLSECNAYKSLIKNIHDAPRKMAAAMIILAFGSIFFGYFTHDLFVGIGTNFWGNSIFVLPQNITIVEAEFLPVHIKLIPVFCSILGAFFAFFTYIFFYTKLISLKLSKIGLNIYTFFNKKWYFDKIYNEYINQFFLKISYNVTYKTIDKGILEFFGPYGFSHLVYTISLKVNKNQTGYIYHYALLMIIGIIISITIIGLLEFLL